MSEYECFNCCKTEHCSDLNEIHYKNLVTLLCDDCIKKMFVDLEEDTQK